MRVMLDTMIFDRIVATEGLAERLSRAQALGVLTLLTTEVQEGQLLAAPADKRRSFRAVKRLVVPSTGDGAVLSEDAVIAASAMASAEALVTEDRELRAELEARRFPVWSFRDLRDYVATR